MLNGEWRKLSGDGQLVTMANGKNYRVVDFHMLNAGRASGRESFLLPVDENDEPMIQVGSGLVDCFPPNIVHRVPEKYGLPVYGMGRFDEFCKFSEFNIGINHAINHKYKDDTEDDEILCHESMRKYLADLLAWVEADVHEYETMETVRERSRINHRQRVKERIRAKREAEANKES